MTTKTEQKDQEKKPVVKKKKTPVQAKNCNCLTEQELTEIREMVNPTPSAFNKARIGQKILAVSAKIAQVKPDGQVKYGKTEYEYISSNKLTMKLNTIFSENLLLIIPEVLSSETIQSMSRDGQGNEKIHYKTTVVIEFEILDCETGFSIKKQYRGSSIDTNGKELAQAITDATKRFYLKLFFVAESDIDPDAVIPENATANAVNNNHAGNYQKPMPAVSQEKTDMLKKLPDDLKAEMRALGYNAQTAINLMEIFDGDVEKTGNYITFLTEVKTNNLKVDKSDQQYVVGEIKKGASREAVLSGIENLKKREESK